MKLLDQWLDKQTQQQMWLTVIEIAVIAGAALLADWLVADPLGENLARAILVAGALHLAVGTYRDWRRWRL